MSTKEMREARAKVDAASETLEAAPRSFGGHRHFASHGLIDLGVVDGFVPFARGEAVRLLNSGRRGTFKGMVGARGGALVELRGSGKIVVPARRLARP